MSQKSFPLLLALSVHVDAFTSLACSTVFLFDLNKSSRMDVSPIRSVIWEELLVWVELDATQPSVEMLDDHIGCSLSLKGCEEVVMLVLLSFTGAQLLWGTCPEVDDKNLSVEDILTLLFVRFDVWWGLRSLMFFCHAQPQGLVPQLEV